MKRIISPVPLKKLEQELTQDTFVRHTNFGGNHIYSVNCHNAPEVIREIGRLRELTFRSAGGGTGKEMDLDELDLSEKPYEQLVVWDPKRKEILGGYRYILGKNAAVDANGHIQLATSHLFHFSDTFRNEYLPYTLELGRSFVQPGYQNTTEGRRGIFALDNLWDGLGALIIMFPEVKYFFGKVTMYPDFNRQARDMILYFLKKYFGDKEGLVTPITPLIIGSPDSELEKYFDKADYLENYKILSQQVRSLGENIPPLINSYMNLSPTMKSFGTAINDEFGEVEETGILITIKDIYHVKKERHILSFKLPKRFSFLKKRRKKTKE